MDLPVDNFQSLSIRNNTPFRKQLVQYAKYQEVVCLKIYKNTKINSMIYLKINIINWIEKKYKINYGYWN